jgi:hypothetical protein
LAKSKPGNRKRKRPAIINLRRSLSTNGGSNSRNTKNTRSPGQGKAYTDEARLHELERMVGRLTMENDFLKKLLKTYQNEV